MNKMTNIFEIFLHLCVKDFDLWTNKEHLFAHVMSFYKRGIKYNLFAPVRHIFDNALKCHSGFESRA